MPKPTFLFIPGAWHTPWHYSFAVQYLNAKGYPTLTIPHLSNHRDGPWTETFDDDAANIRAVLHHEAETGHEVIVVMHSYGGAPGGAACKGLLLPQRENEGRKGGVRELVYVSSFALDEGASFGAKLEDPRLKDNPDGSMTHDDPADSFYHDVPEPLRTQAIENLVKISQRVRGVEQTFAPWKHVPASYIICEEDRALPAEIQRMFSSQKGGQWNLVKAPTGHSPFLVNPEVFGELLIRIANGQSTDGLAWLKKDSGSGNQ